jgi:TonB family protein
MILPWMLYCVVVGVVLGTAAALAEAACRHRGLAVRPIWAGAGAITVALCAVAWWAPGTGLPVGVGLGPLMVVGAPAAGAAADAWWVERVWTSAAAVVGRLGGVARSVRPLEPIVLGLWAAVSGALVLVLAGSAFALRRQAARWRRTRLRGVDVTISHAMGPAVVGVVRPRIVLPSWVLGEPDEAQGFVLRHEQEHLHAGDPWLVLASFLAAVLMPWNLALWWQFRRLREAVELDCDRRVLRYAGPARRRAYGELLFRVAHHLRAGVPRPALACFAERGTALERRIRTMLRLASPLPIKWTLTLIVGSAGLLALACSVPGPDSATAPETTEATSEVYEAAEVADEGEAGPRFTPYTVGPDITNRVEVTEALRSEYPPLLRNAGIGGTVTVWFYIDETGEVQDTRVQEGSGHAPLDEAALRVASKMHFTPALNRDQPVPVWVAFPITFQAR